MAKGVGTWVAVSCGGTDVGRTGLDEQYFRSRSAASLVSPTVLLLRASTTLLHVGIRGGGGGRILTML